MAADAPHSALIASEITHRIIGAFFETYNELGPGFPEFVARRALGIAVRDTGLPAHEEVELPVWFRGRRVATFRADLLVADSIIVEVKASADIEPFHVSQLLHYLKASGLELGLLVNFGREPRFRRIVYQSARNRPVWSAPSTPDLDNGSSSSGDDNVR